MRYDNRDGDLNLFIDISDISADNYDSGDADVSPQSRPARSQPRLNGGAIDRVLHIRFSRS